ncbi:caspase family protein [Candidatus Woesearchaeota archaeon]|nr:caspase family protein [Candidatus Woesearchaeota archaeon]
MTTAKLTGLAPEFANVNVTISRPTLLGRSLPDRDGKIKLTSAVDHYLPPDLRGTAVDSIFTFGPGTEATSRHHALIYPVGERFMLTDLGATNGTFYSFMDDRRRLFRGSTYLLRDNDIIHLGNPHGGIRFRIEYVSSPPPPKPESLPSFHQRLDQLAYEATQNYALLVGSQGNLKGVENDTAAVKRTLESRRGFSGNIETLLGERANFNTVVHKLEQLEHRATPQSLTVFYYSGHGMEDGGDLDLHGVAKISPRELYLFLRDIPGRKVVIIDACNSSHFADKEIITPQTLVLAASRENAYEGDVGDGRRMGYFTRALLRLIDSSQTRLNLKELQEQLGADVKLARKGQEPQVVGETIFVGTQMINVEELL